jgi:hypothetical protein
MRDTTDPPVSPAQSHACSQLGGPCPQDRYRSAICLFANRRFAVTDSIGVPRHPQVEPVGSPRADLAKVMSRTAT